MCVSVSVSVCVCVCVYVRVETRSDHPGQLGYILSWTSGPDPLYKISVGLTRILHCITCVDDGIWPW